MRSPTKKPSGKELQAEFLRRIGSPQQVLNLLNFFPNSFFFVKDEHSRIIWVSQSKRERMGAEEESGLVGKTDYDFFPKHVADGFVRDDLEVMKTHLPLLKRAEMWFSWDRKLQWSITTKMPLLDAHDRAIGVIGFVENSATVKAFASDSAIGRAIAFVEANHTQALAVREIAAAAHLSERQLLRVFQQSLGVSVQEFALRVRIEAASVALLDEQATVLQVAHAFGFCDQSAFTRQFRLQRGTTPGAFQRKYRHAPGNLEASGKWSART